MATRQMSSPKKKDMEDAGQAAAPFEGNIDGMVIRFPNIGAIPIIKPVEKEGSIDRTQSGETAGTASLQDSEEELLQQVEATIGKHLSAVFDGDARNDSFLNRLSALSQSRKSSINGSLEKYLIGGLDDDDDDDDIDDVVSRVSGLDAGFATHRELIDAVERLNEYLKQTELELSDEKRKRRLREKNLIKLAKELGTRGKIIERQLETMSEMKNELRSARADVALLETELKSEIFLNRETKLDSKKDYARTIAEAQVVYNHTVSEHDRRISHISKTHAKQCEELCREVIEANQETVRLRRKLKELNNGANADRGPQVCQTSKGNLVLKMITLVVIAVTAYVALSASGESPVGMCSGSAGAPKLDMTNAQLFVPRATIPKPTISKPTIAKRIAASQSVEARKPAKTAVETPSAFFSAVKAAAPPTSSLPVEPREIQIHVPKEVSIEAVVARRPHIFQLVDMIDSVLAKIGGIKTFVGNSKLSTGTWIQRRTEAVVQMFSLNVRPDLVKGLSMTPDLPENALLTLILKGN